MKRDEDGKPPEVVVVVVVIGVDPKDIDAPVAVPNGVVVGAADEPPPNVNDELAVVGAEATVVVGVDPNANADG